MPARRTRVLAHGDFVAADPDENFVVLNARLRVLWEIERLCPHVLESLKTEVLPVCSRALQENELLNSDSSSFQRLLRGEPKAALDDWLAKCNSDCNWFKEEAIRAMANWCIEPESLRYLKWNPVQSRMRFTKDAGPFCFRFNAWEMELLPWFEYARSAKDKFEKELQEYKDHAYDIANSHGLVPVRKKYSRDSFTWFVLRYFGGLSYIQIATRRSKGSGDESAVRKGVTTVEELIGWPHLRKTVHRKIR